MVSTNRVGIAEEFLEAFNEQDWERMRSLLTDDCVHEQLARPKRRVEGADAVVALFQGWATAMPDARGEIAATVVGDRGVTLEIEWVGTMTGPFGDFSPTGRRQSAQAALVFHLEDGQIKEFRHYFDSLVVFQLLGVNP